MNTNQIVRAAVQKLAENPHMPEYQIRDICARMVNLTLQVVVENIKDDENPIMLREKIKGMGVK